MEPKTCKNRKCSKVLPEGYKYKRCERCRKKRSDIFKNTIGGFAAAVGAIAVAIAKTGTNSNNK